MIASATIFRIHVVELKKKNCSMLSIEQHFASHIPENSFLTDSNPSLW